MIREKGEGVVVGIRSSAYTFPFVGLKKKKLINFCCCSGKGCHLICRFTSCVRIRGKPTCQLSSVDPDT